MILELIVLSQLAAASPAPQAAEADSIPTVTLEQALQAAALLDPNYVAALGGIDDATWGRRAALAVFVLPSVSLQTSLTKASDPFFNVGTGDIASQIVDARVQLGYDLFRGGSKFFELARTRAELESAQANETRTRFATAVLTESDYYDVLAETELTRVASDRVRRAREQLAVARARVLTGAAVQTDSLQLLLELTRAQVDLLRQQATLRVARVQLGRRIGYPGPVDAAPIDTTPMPDLPIREDSAVSEALMQGPEFRRSVADERAASAALKQARAAYLPWVSLFASWQGFDEKYFPEATTRTLYGFQVTFPLWNNAQREIALARARTARDVARAVMEDTELAVRRDVIQAYQAYNTARAAEDLALQGVTVARENLDVQNTRYRAGATTILDLLSAQVALSEAEAAAVQARYATRLALAGLEALLGRRLFTDR
ncbi:MAG: TolC family protein [Gemmatimonadetes bacterium]|uniref:TolC family protein n=1 Tax=Candidatus Kutchimonas denitrificans TaxID=3056748 RepID=A0AAE4Z545_9BACT|nr:TolC family protein [Gemmatimonadota bacterium]NIR73504.1 TolC family protein [Candidatus Kutchimonas denitrificans]NIR99463.1 TolC family protein [Gemmatimonadota bacterium]NIT65083.1 TolC family protein [Gemmatimonadota bacterium]NIV23616.1 TolC family protein [Gemmatimonadota bacterium]